MSKIVSLARLQGVGGVLCHGTYDLLHIGHVKFLKEAAKHGPLTVTLTAGAYIRHHGPGRPVFTDDERLEMVSELECVSRVALVADETAKPAISMIQPQYFCKGDETRREGNEILRQEMALVDYYGGKVLFIKKYGLYSSGRLLSGEILRAKS